MKVTVTPLPHRLVKRPRVSTSAGLAQNTLVEHALSPLDVREALQPGSLHVVQYGYTDKNRNRKTATANVACPFGLSPNDEFYLYGLLALTFAQPEPSVDFYATPHWCLRQLGVVTPQAEQGKRYAIFREALRRLAGVVYENDRFLRSDSWRAPRRSFRITQIQLANRSSIVAGVALRLGPAVLSLLPSDCWELPV